MCALATLESFDGTGLCVDPLTWGLPQNDTDHIWSYQKIEWPTLRLSCCYLRVCGADGRVHSWSFNDDIQYKSKISVPALLDVSSDISCMFAKEGVIPPHTTGWNTSDVEARITRCVYNQGAMRKYSNGSSLILEICPDIVFLLRTKDRKRVRWDVARFDAANIVNDLKLMNQDSPRKAESYLDVYWAACTV